MDVCIRKLNKMAYRGSTPLHDLLISSGQIISGPPDQPFLASDTILAVSVDAATNCSKLQSLVEPDDLGLDDRGDVNLLARKVSSGPFEEELIAG